MGISWMKEEEKEEKKTKREKTKLSRKEEFMPEATTFIAD